MRNWLSGVGAKFTAAASMILGVMFTEILKAPAFTYEIECIGPDGKLKWRETIHNLVTTAGKNHIINTEFTSGTQITAWFLGLKAAGTAAITDTLASHGGWAESNPYSGNRPGITFGSTSAGSNTATAISYAITGTATIAGAFICSAASGTSGTLYSAGDFAAARSVLSGDTLNVTPTVSAS